MELTFDVELGSFSATTDEPKEADEEARAKKNILVDLAGAKSKEKKGNIHIVLRVEGVEPTDDASRLINHLAQTQGVVNTIQID